MEQREPTSSNKKVPVEFFIRLCFKKYKNIGQILEFSRSKWKTLLKLFIEYKKCNN